jgi:hypothetical protein
MLKSLANLCRLLATLCALLSPIAVVHWIFQAFHLPPQLDGVMGFFSAVFSPVNSILDSLFHFPSLTFQDKAVPITQGVHALLITILFFVFNFLSGLVSTADKKVQAATDTFVRKTHIQHEQAAKEKQQKKIVKEKRPIVYVAYPFHQDAKVCDFLSEYGPLGGWQIESSPEFWLLEFARVEQALAYCGSAAQKILGYYTTLRPMDPQFPFRMILHGVDTGAEHLAWGKERCQTMARLTGENQVRFSQEIKEVMDASQLNDTFKSQSVGMYEFPIVGIQEAFQLTIQPPPQRY